ncbi:MAG: NUDIX domain-containing protein [Phycisphaerales bacterium]|nr:NUDIX domain-containing protein [Phycisphaerales bacterium]
MALHAAPFLALVLMRKAARTSRPSLDRQAASEAVVRGVVAVIENRGCWLMIQRGPGVCRAGAWCFPGGAIEPGESPRDALVREIHEELSIRVAPGRPVWNWTSDDSRLELEWWTAGIIDGRIRPDADEVADWRWVRPDDLHKLPDLLSNNLQFAAYAAANGLCPD